MNIDEPNRHALDAAAEATAALRDAAADLVIPAAIVLGLFYALMVPAHLLMLPPAAAPALMSLAAMSSLAYLTFAGLHPERLIQRHSHAIIGSFALIALTNTIVHFTLVPHPELATNFVIVLLGCGLLILAPVWFYPLVLATLAAWILISNWHGLDGADSNWTWFVLGIVVVASALHEMHRRMVLRTVRRESTLRHHVEVLRRLLRAPEVAGSDAAATFRLLDRTATEALDVDRASVWLFDNDGESLVRRHLHDRAPLPADDFDTIDRAVAPAYFAAVEHFILAEDAHAHPATRELDAGYLTPLGLDALLDSPMFLQGRVVGVVCLEHRGGARRWTDEDSAFAASLSGVAALALEAENRLELERRTRHAERLEALGIMAGGVAHDFNNLLTAILGHADVLSEKLQGNPALEHHVAGVVQASERATALSRKMLTYSGRATLNTRAINLGTTLGELIDGWVATNPDALSVQLDGPGTDVTIEADPVELGQIVPNVLDNAVAAGAERVHVSWGRQDLDSREIEASIVDRGVEPGPFCYAEFLDDGAGMTPETAHRVFEPFYSTRKRGRGLGLSAVLGIVRGHGGTIQLDSAPDQGTRMRFLFPALTRAEVIDINDGERPAEDPQPTTGNTVLVVEDEVMVAQMLEAMLERSGLDTHAVHDLAELRSYLNRTSLDGVRTAFVDLTLPDGDGVDAVHALRASRSDLPIILMSGYDSDQALARLRNQDLLRFLGKPFSRKQVEEALGAVSG